MRDTTDIADVTGAACTYLMNGPHPGANWTGPFPPGERVRLSDINASATTFFNVRIPGLPMSAVQADGQNVEPVETDEFQIGVAETLDAIVRPSADRACTVMAESMDRSGFVRGTLARRSGMQAAVPPLREPPRRTMLDMGMTMAMDGEPGDSGTGLENVDHRVLIRAQLRGFRLRGEFARAEGDPLANTSFVVGLRAWF